MKITSSPSRRHACLNRRQAGMTLIEVLISVLILVIGLLGLAAMQMQSVKFNDSARWRSQATFLAYDIVERMRANKINATAYVNGGDAIANADMREWREQLALIGGGSSSIALSNSNKTVTVSMSIQDLNRTQANASATTFVYTTLLD